GDLARDQGRLLGRDRSAPEPLLEVLAEHELHREEADRGRGTLRPRLLEREEAGDVGVRERGQELRLALEPLEPRGIGSEGVRQQLERDAASEARVGRLPHLAHAAPAEGSLDLVGTEARAGGDGQGLPPPAYGASARFYAEARPRHARREARTL